jgi:hypothetical protein
MMKMVTARRMTMMTMGDLRRGDRRAPYSTFTLTASRCVLLLQQVETRHKLTEIHLTGKEPTKRRQGRRCLPLGDKRRWPKGMRQGTRGREEAARLQVVTTMTMTRMTKALATKVTELLAV